MGRETPAQLDWTLLPESLPALTGALKACVWAGDQLAPLTHFPGFLLFYSILSLDSELPVLETGECFLIKEGVYMCDTV